MKKTIEKPKCEKCDVQMIILSTGELIRTFYCPKCNETKIVKREKG